MKRGIQGILTTLAVAFLSTFALHACDENGFPLGIVLDGMLTPGSFSAENYSCNTSNDCDGDVLTKTFVTAVSTSANNATFTVTIGETSYTVLSGGDTSARTIETQLISCINNGTGEGGEPTCSQATGSSVVTASSGSIVVKGVTPDTDYTIATSATEGGVLDTPTDLTQQDLRQLFQELYWPLSWIDPAQLVAAADADDRLPVVPTGEERTVRITGSKESDCDDGGSVTETTTVDAVINDSAVLQETTFQLRRFDFMECLLEDDLLLGNGGPTESISIDGTITYTSVYDPDEGSGWWGWTGTLQLDTDDGTATPFWTDSVNFNLMRHYNGSDFWNGGVCLGGNVIFGGDAEDDTDDDCGLGGILYVSGSDWDNIID